MIVSSFFLIPSIRDSEGITVQSHGHQSVEIAGKVSVLKGHWKAPVFITAITVSELLYRVHRAEGAKRRKRECFVEEFISGILVIPCNTSADR